MKEPNQEYYPIFGKTYSLFGKSDSTSGYYETISNLVDKILALNPDTRDLINSIREFSSNKKILKKSLKINDTGNLMVVILNLIDPYLKVYTENTENHLKTLPLSKFWDRRLATTREQYHLYMLEIELTNRLFAPEFIKADKKIALMPYCLQDFNVKCKSEKKGFDYQCKHCSAKCFQNQASTILKTHQIKPILSKFH